MRGVRWLLGACFVALLGSSGSVGCGDEGPAPPAPSEPIAGGGVAGEPLAGRLEVHVVGAADGAPVSDAHVLVAPGSIRAVSDAAGRALLEDNGLTGPVTVLVEADGLVPFTIVGLMLDRLTVPMASSNAAEPAAVTLSGVLRGGSDLGALPADETRTASVRVTVPARITDLLAATTTTSSCEIDGDGCAFETEARPGTALPYAVIEQVDGSDAHTVIGFAAGEPIEVIAGEPRDDLVLSVLPETDMDRLRVQLGTSPVAEVVGIPGLNVQDVGVVSFGTRTEADLASFAVPALSARFEEGRYWVVGVADAPSEREQSIVVVRGIANLDDTVVVDGFLDPPEPMMTADGIALGPSAGAMVTSFEAQEDGELRWRGIALGPVTIANAGVPGSLAGRTVDLTVRSVRFGDDFDVDDVHLADLERIQTAEATAVRSIVFPSD